MEVLNTVVFGVAKGEAELDLRMLCLAGILLIEISAYPRSVPDVGI